PALVIDPNIMARLPRAAMRALSSRDHQLAGYDDFLAHFANAHPRLRAPSKRWLTFRARAVDEIARWFERVLDRAQPELALISCYTSLPGMALSLAAARKQLRAVDVQHGVTVQNPAYEGWTRFPEGGYELLPDLFWCWTE